MDSYLKYIDYLESLERMPNGESLRMFSEACGAAWRAIQQAWTSPRGLWLLLTWARMMQHACRQLGYPDLSQAPEYVRWALLIFVSGFYLNPRGGVSLDEAARAVGVACVGQIFALHGAIPTFNDATWFIAQLPLKDMARVVQERSEPMRVTVQAFWGEVIQQDGSW
ncbi:MAG: hypothetical protein RML46_11290 [Anaerolineae bacterium]|nr:hypothetical protein [Anaerolineae bacterium]